MVDKQRVACRLKADPVTEMCENCGLPVYRTRRGWMHEWPSRDETEKRVPVTTER